MKFSTTSIEEISLSKLCQISIDCMTLMYCCDKYLPEILFNSLLQVNWLESMERHVTQIFQNIKSKLYQISTQSYDIIFELITMKITDLMSSLIFIPTTPSSLAPSSTSTSPGAGCTTDGHECILEIIQYLQITFISFTYLPHNIRESLYFISCSLINSLILSHLLSSKVSSLNMFCIKILQNDYKFLDSFAESSGVTQLKECFTEGRNLINALLSFDLCSFGDTSSTSSTSTSTATSAPAVLRKAQFPVLDLNKLVMLFEKVNCFLFSDSSSPHHLTILL